MVIGTNQAPLDYYNNNDWYGLHAIVLYFTQNQFLISAYQFGDFDYDYDHQLAYLSKIFHYYYGQIVDLFRPEVISRVGPEIVQAGIYISRKTLTSENERLIEQKKKFLNEIDKEVG